MKPKYWLIRAHETLVHEWSIEAETKEKAEEIASSGCPKLDGDCHSVAFDIVEVKLECDCCEGMISQLGCCCEERLKQGG